jgi:hypothetical protein
MLCRGRGFSKQKKTQMFRHRRMSKGVVGARARASPQLDKQSAVVIHFTTTEAPHLTSHSTSEGELTRVDPICPGILAVSVVT